MAIPDFIQEALDRAPPVGDDIDPEEIAEVLRASAELRSGEVASIPTTR
jgi:hypothetical protein